MLTLHQKVRNPCQLCLLAVVNLTAQLSGAFIQDASNVEVLSTTNSGTGSKETLHGKVPSTAALSQLIIKFVFGRVLAREEVNTIWKLKFSVKKSQLTSLTASLLSTVLIKRHEI